MGCHFLLQGIFPIQGLNPGPSGRQILYWLSHQGSIEGLVLSKCLLNQAIKRESHWIITRKSFLANRPHQVPLRYRHWFYLRKKICVLSWGPRGTIFVSSGPFFPLLPSCLHLPFLPKISGDLRLNPRTKSKAPFLTCRIFIFGLWNTFFCCQLPLHLSLIKFSDSQIQARPFHWPTMTLNINPPKKKKYGEFEERKRRLHLCFGGFFVRLVGWVFVLVFFFATIRGFWDFSF